MSNSTNDSVERLSERVIEVGKERDAAAAMVHELRGVLEQIAAQEHVSGTKTSPYWLARQALKKAPPRSLYAELAAEILKARTLLSDVDCEGENLETQVLAACGEIRRSWDRVDVPAVERTCEHFDIRADVFMAELRSGDQAKRSG